MNSKSLFALILTPVALAFFCVLGYLAFSAPKVSEISPAVPLAAVAAPLPVQISETRLRFVGDIMLGRGVARSVEKNFNGSYSQMLDKVGALSDSDILFGNLEGPISDKGTDLHNLYSFRFATSTIPALEAAGFDVLLIANNHVGDWGRAAFDDSLARLKSSSIVPVGGGEDKADAETPRIIEKNGIKFGVLGLTDVGPDWLEAGTSTSGILLASDPNLTSIISAAARTCDVLIVLVHWGVEYEKKHDARQEKIAHELIDSGARLVIGTHPHVVEDTEEYGGGLIAYSLGNFIFDQYFSKDTMQGGLLSVTFKGKDAFSHDMKPVFISRHFQPSLESL